MKRNIYYIAVLILAVAAGAATGIYRARQRSIDQSTNVSSTTADQGSTTLASGTDGAAADAQVDGGAPESPKETTQESVPVPTYIEVKHNSSSTPEALAVNAVNAFEEALNTKDATSISQLFADSVDTSKLPLVLNDMHTYPLSVAITNVDVRADDSVVIAVTETRQDENGNQLRSDRVFELIPRENDYAVASYMLAEGTDPLSGFAN